MSLHSPFFHRGPIRDRSYFFGRQRHVARALSLLGQGQSVALVGPRRIGKTSLLFQLMDRDVQQAHGSAPAPLRCCYVDCEALGQAAPDELFRRLGRTILRELSVHGVPADSSQSDRPDSFATVEQLVSQFAPSGEQLVLLLDEFETLAANPLLDNHFFAGLRALAMEHRLAYVTVSTRPLLELTYPQVRPRSSPFFNFFAMLPIGLFARQESMALLQELSARGGLPFTEALCEGLVAAAGDHPFFLQMCADTAFQEMAAGEEQSPELISRLLDGPFGVEASDHWRAFWLQLTPEERRLLALLPILAPTQPAAVRRLEAAGLVVKTASDAFALCGGGWQRFVAAQPLPELIQAPPLTLDPSLRVALLRGQPLALPPRAFELLCYLVSRRERMVSREELCVALWGNDGPSSYESLRTALTGLRAALGADERCLRTVRGQGYQFVGHSQ